jgi:phosphate-selective porin OprO and OprP
MLAIFIFFFSSINSHAQTVELPTLDYGKDGVVVKHAPSHFVMKTRFRIQTRATYEDYDSDGATEDLTDFQVRRMRLRFDGTALDPRFLYKIQLSFTRGDMDFDNTSYPNILRDAAVGWKLFNEDSFKSTLWFGQTKLPGNRQRVISSANQELVDRSLLNATFNIDRDMGVQWYNQIGESRPLWIKVALSNGEGRANNNKNTGLSYTGRVEWLPLGAFTDEGDYYEGDLAREQTVKISLGVSYNVNRKTNRVGGQIGKTFASGVTTDMETLLADFLLKYNGWAWSAEYANRTTDNPFILIGATPDAVFKGSGYHTQLSYLFSNNWSPIVRYTQVIPNHDILNFENEKTQYTVGVTKYLNQHKIKIMGDVTYEDEKERTTTANANLQNWMARVQLEFGI